ncbi:MAG: GTPase domain-containing protein [Myxococcota bacterium]
MSEAQARIVLWGIEGAGKSTTLRTIHARLRPESRGELVRLPSRLDPTVFAESLAISLGDLGGRAMQIEVVAVPGGEDQAMTRKQLLDQVDGVVLVLDCSPGRIDANASAIEELRQSLAAYGQRLESLPVVLQYNKRDVADPFAIESLHRKIGLREAAVFETIATTGHGVLPTLTTISKHVIRLHRDGSSSRATTTAGTTPTAAASATAPAAPATARPATHAAQTSASAAAGPPGSPAAHGGTPRAAHEILEAGILADAGADDGRDALSLDFDRTTQPDWGRVQQELEKSDERLGEALRIVSAGQATIAVDGTLSLPIVLGDRSGQTRSVVLHLRLDDLARSGGG